MINHLHSHRRKASIASNLKVSQADEEEQHEEKCFDMFNHDCVESCFRLREVVSI